MLDAAQDEAIGAKEAARVIEHLRLTAGRGLTFFAVITSLAGVSSTADGPPLAASMWISPGVFANHIAATKGDVDQHREVTLDCERQNTPVRVAIAKRAVKAATSRGYQRIFLRSTPRRFEHDVARGR